MGGMAFELTDQIERHLTGDQIAWLTTVTRPGGRHPGQSGSSGTAP